jgi:Cu2+-exporting ATPase
MLLRAQTRRETAPGLPAWLVPAFILAVLTIAFATWFGWTRVEPDTAFPAMLAVLVASCPCALSLALPAVYAAASQRLLNEGILLTRGDALKALTAIDQVIFDKTGTLTSGLPLVSKVTLNPERSGLTETYVLDIAGRMESSSGHPLARAFPQTGIDLPQVQVVAGMGLQADIDGRQWRLGQADFAAADAVGGETSAETEIWLSDERGWLARIELSDAMREGAVQAVQSLFQQGLEISILSGDSASAVKRIADQAGISAWQARKSPADKLQEIEKIKTRGKHVLMVGDGVNDAPVLAAADVSMTVKGGSELANSAADMILTGESLGLVLRARDIAQKAQLLIRQNLAWALVYNLSVVPLAIAGLLQPWMAALGMSLSSLMVVANATRLVRQRSAAPAVAGTGPLKENPS